MNQDGYRQLDVYVPDGRTSSADIGCNRIGMTPRQLTL